MICLEGIIIPASWDHNGNVVDLAIATRDEKEYLIAADRDQVARLKPLLRQEVALRGILQSEGARKIIRVEGFSKLRNKDYHRN